MNQEKRLESQRESCIQEVTDIILKGAIEANKSILSLMEQYATVGGLPSNTSEHSDYWQNLGELCEKMANESPNATLKKKWLKEARHAFVQAFNVRVVTFGKMHLKTQHMQQNKA